MGLLPSSQRGWRVRCQAPVSTSGCEVGHLGSSPGSSPSSRHPPNKWPVATTTAFTLYKPKSPQYLLRKDHNISHSATAILKMAQETPSVGTWIRDHKLGDEIMHRIDDGITPPTGGGAPSYPPNGVMDDSELDLLERFVTNPTLENRMAILKDHDMVPEPGDDNPGKRAYRKGSLAGFIIASFGSDRPAVTDGEIEELREWFGRGRKD